MLQAVSESLKIHGRAGKRPGRERAAEWGNPLETTPHDGETSQNKPHAQAFTAMCVRICDCGFFSWLGRWPNRDRAKGLGFFLPGFSLLDGLLRITGRHVFAAWTASCFPHRISALWASSVAFPRRSFQSQPQTGCPQKRRTHAGLLCPFETWLFPPKSRETTIYKAMFRCM